MMARVWNQLSKEEKKRDVSSLTEKELNELVELGELVLVAEPQALYAN